jgi:peptidoglycan/xylan/chitin deacetylase (PgdA/CDA1 family)
MNTATTIYRKIRRHSGYALNDMRGSLGMNKTFFQQARGSRIIVYHGICQEDPTRFNSLFLLASTFEEHLQFYQQYFHIVSLDAYYKQQFRSDRFNICITFDDGFANNFKYVLPLMYKYRIPISFFITSILETGYNFLWNDYLSFLQQYGPGQLSLWGDHFNKDRHGRYLSINTGRYLREDLQSTGFDKKNELIRLLEPSLSLADKVPDKDYWLQMTRQEIKTLSVSHLATIGCHGYYHNDLGRIPLDDATRELALNKRYLEEITRKEIRSLAFPYGSYTRELATTARSLGFDHLLAQDFLFPGDHTDETMRERLGVNPYISVNNQMTAIIKGRYLS